MSVKTQKIRYRHLPERSCGIESAYAIELDDTDHNAPRTVGWVTGRGTYWLALGIGYDRWCPSFPTRESAVNALLMVRGEGEWWGRHMPQAPAMWSDQVPADAPALRRARLGALRG